MELNGEGISKSKTSKDEGGIQFFFFPTKFVISARPKQTPFSESYQGS